MATCRSHSLVGSRNFSINQIAYQYGQHTTPQHACLFLLFKLCTCRICCVGLQSQFVSYLLLVLRLVNYHAGAHIAPHWPRWMADLTASVGVLTTVMYIQRRPQPTHSIVIGILNHATVKQQLSHNSCRFLLITISEGCLPTNQLWYVDLQSLQGSEDEGALDFAPYDFHSAPGALPVVKLVDNFDAQYEYVANEGTECTFQTNYKAPLYRWTT